MVIKGVGNVAVPQGGPARAGAPSSGFAVRTGAGSVGGPAAMSAASALDALLLLQEEVEDAPTRDRRARKHGRALLDALAELQLGLLGGEGEEGSLRTLASLVEQCPDAADPSLRELVGAVALRARVELARRQL